MRRARNSLDVPRRERPSKQQGLPGETECVERETPWTRLEEGYKCWINRGPIWELETCLVPKESEVHLGDNTSFVGRPRNKRSPARLGVQPRQKQLYQRNMKKGIRIGIIIRRNLFLNSVTEPRPQRDMYRESLIKVKHSSLGPWITYDYLQ